VSGNPGGRPKKKPITEELERLLREEAPNGDGQTWATAIAKALLQEASKGDVRAISELTNRVEGKPLQALSIGCEDASGHSPEEIDRQIKELEEQLGLCESCRGRTNKLR
jgi:hypothetical protein